jgi:hypothetical protein
MNILIVSDFNIGGQPTFLMRAINKYTPHQARCVIAYDDSFRYDRDILLSKETMPEATQLANEWADFYHFGSYIFNWPGVDFNKLVTKNNTCIKYYGSYLRQNGERLRDFHRATGIPAITGTDFTITSKLDFSYFHLGSYFTAYGDLDPSNIPSCRSPNGKLRICGGSAGNPLKGYDVLVQAVNELIQEGEKIEMEIIEGLTNRECLEIKQGCQATFGSLHGGWGISGVESMFLSHAVLTCLDPFVLSLYPDNPAILVDKDNLKIKIRELCVSPHLWDMASEDGYRFAMKHFRTKDLVTKYMYVLDLIRGREKYEQGYHLPEELY